MFQGSEEEEDGKMSAGTSEFFCLICFLVCSCSAQMNIRHENITAEVGKDVILPYKVPNINIIITAVEWNRPELGEDYYVLLYRNGHLDPYNQHPSYQNRVDLQDKEMKDGNVSLILKNVTKQDTGRYECLVFEEGKIELINIFNLEVLPSAQTIIKAEVGKEVILPCKAPNNININNIAVEWNRPELGEDYYVLLYQDGRLDPYNQHPSYQNRVDLQDKEMKDGNFSLILNNVTMEDTGTYECRVFEKGKIEPIQSIVNLKVHRSGDKAEITGDGGDKTGVIVGSVVGVILLLLLLVASVGFWLYRRHMRQNPNLSIPPDEAAAEQML